MLKELRVLKKAISDLNRYERRIYSQNGEDGILQAIFKVIGTTNKFSVEFGVGDGHQCNTALLQRRRGWSGLMMDCTDKPPIAKLKIQNEFITAENIESLFQKYKVPKKFDLLSIDIDGNDFWIWKAIKNYKPRVVVIEYNANFPPTEALTIPYDPKFRWQGSSHYGATLGALKKLGEEKGYTLVACDDSGTNSFFVEDYLVLGHFAPKSIEQIYRTPKYKDGKGYQPDPERKMMQV